MDIQKQAENAKTASYEFGNSSIALRNEALTAIADELLLNTKTILAANAIDIANAKTKGLTEAMLDRLLLNESRIKGISDAVRDIMLLPDILGSAENWVRPNGLVIGKKRVPIGVIGVIYESRPNVTIDAAALCLKSGNAVVLRGGSEAIKSNTELVRIMRNSLAKVGLSTSLIAFVEDTSRETSIAMTKLNKHIDLLIPRGGLGLKKSITENATIPVIFADAGNCHTYIDEFADLEMGAEILVNAKTQRPSVCNACETLLVHEKVAKAFLLLLQKKLKKWNVEIRGCERTRTFMKCNAATEDDYATEFNDLILAIKIVKNLDSALAHINKYGTRHSECIVTENLANSQKFLDMVDAAAVYVNASTRFTDGNEFGFGAEIGISTQKLHARGPLGLNELTTYKYVILGNGQVRG